MTRATCRSPEQQSRRSRSWTLLKVHVFNTTHWSKPEWLPFFNVKVVTVLQFVERWRQADLFHKLYLSTCTGGFLTQALPEDLAQALRRFPVPWTVVPFREVQIWRVSHVLILDICHMSKLVVLIGASRWIFGSWGWKSSCRMGCEHGSKMCWTWLCPGSGYLDFDFGLSSDPRLSADPSRKADLLGLERAFRLWRLSASAQWPGAEQLVLSVTQSWTIFRSPSSCMWATRVRRVPETEKWLRSSCFNPKKGIILEPKKRPWKLEMFLTTSYYCVMLILTVIFIESKQLVQTSHVL